MLFRYERHELGLRISSYLTKKQSRRRTGLHEMETVSVVICFRRKVCANFYFKNRYLKLEVFFSIFSYFHSTHGIQLGVEY